jgi:hypothetical protein
MGNASGKPRGGAGGGPGDASSTAGTGTTAEATATGSNVGARAPRRPDGQGQDGSKARESGAQEGKEGDKDKGKRDPRYESAEVGAGTLGRCAANTCINY